MLGTWVNFFAIIVGSVLGLGLGAYLPERLKNTVTASVGLFTIGLGMRLFFDSANVLIVLGGLLTGALLGEWLRLEDFLEGVGSRLEARFNRQGDSSRFIQGFMAASLLFAVGPMAILGSIQDGMTGDITTLAVKSVMDGFTSIAFAATLGLGVLFSAFVVLLYQGSITLLAAQLSALVNQQMILEMQAAGGLILIGLALSSLLEIKKIRTGNLLPALVTTPLLVWLVTLVQQLR
jgi:hypothetical protein